jgi:MFS family permease
LTTSAIASAPSRWAYPALLAVATVDAAGYSVIGPVLPAVQQATGATVGRISLVAATFPLAMLAGFPLGGRMARAGRTRVALLLGAGLVLAGGLAFLAPPDLATLTIGRAVMGVGSGCLWIAVTFRTLEYWPGQEYRCMSRVYAAYSAGALIGPALGSLGGVRLPFAAYLVLVVACMPLAIVLPPSRRSRSFALDTQVLRSNGFWFASAAILLAMLGIGVVDGVLPLHLATGMSQAQIGGSYTATGLLVVGAAGAAGHMRPSTALAVGGVALVLGVTLAGLGTAVPLWLAALAVLGLGTGAAETGATGVLLEQVPTERIVTAMVVWSQIGIAGYLLGPAVGGPLVTALGYGWLGLLPLAAAAPVLGTAVLVHRRSTRSPGGSTA